jgi:adenylate kinase family enzyme
MEKIIIVGKMASGKTTVANHLCDKWGYTKIALADPIHQIVNLLESDKSNDEIFIECIGKYYDVDLMQRAMFYKVFDDTRKIPLEFPKPRKRLQYLGTDGVRQRIDKNFWIKFTELRSEQLGVNKIVMDDIRFRDEYDFFANRNWTPIKLIISNYEQDRRLRKLYGEYDPDILKHSSELDQDIICGLPGGLIITNNDHIENTLNIIDVFLNKKSAEI